MQCQWLERKTQAVRQKECNMRARLKARARSQRSASINFARRGSKRTVMKKYRSERNGRRNFDTPLRYNTAGVTASQKTRTAKAAVRATVLSSMLTNRHK